MEVPGAESVLCGYSLVGGESRAGESAFSCVRFTSDANRALSASGAVLCFSFSFLDPVSFPSRSAMRSCIRCVSPSLSLSGAFAMNGLFESSRARGRCDGSFCKQRLTNCLNSSENASPSSRGGGFFGMKNNTRIGCMSAYGGAPVAISIAVIPKLHTSAFASYPSGLCCITSGAIQKGVPVNVLRLCPPTVCVICPATPKSASRTLPSALSNTFAAFTSRWILPSPCRYASAISRSRSTTAHCSSGRGRERTKSATEPPAMYSIAIARRVLPSHSQEPRYFVTNGLSICASVAISRWMSSTSSSASSKSTSFTATVSPVKRSTARCTSPDVPRPMREPSSKRSPVSAMARERAGEARVRCVSVTRGRGVQEKKSDGMSCAVLRVVFSKTVFFSRYSGAPFARAHCSNSRCPRSAACAHVHLSHMQPFARTHCSTSR